MVDAGNHPFARCQVNDLAVDDRTYKYFSLPALGEERYNKLPYSIRVLLESAVRNCDDFNVKRKYPQVVYTLNLIAYRFVKQRLISRRSSTGRQLPKTPSRSLSSRPVCSSKTSPVSLPSLILLP